MDKEFFWELVWFEPLGIFFFIIAVGSFISNTTTGLILGLFFLFLMVIRESLIYHDIKRKLWGRK